jgi:signal transduction histidine kinase
MLSIKARQVAGVTSLVALVGVALSVVHIASLARVRLEESHARGQMLAHAIYQRTRDVAAGDAPYLAIRTDPGIRSLLQSSIGYSRDVTYAAVVDPTGFAIAHSFPSQEGQPMTLQDDLAVLLERGPSSQLRAIYADRTLEIRQPLLMGTNRFGSIRIGMSTLLMREELMLALRPAAVTALAAFGIATFVAMLLAQWILRPIHVIRSGLSRLGRGEFGVTLDLPSDEEFSDLGTSFNAISEQLSTARGQRTDAAGSAPLPAAEDAVAVVSASGRVTFANAVMRASLPDAEPGMPYRRFFPVGHPYRDLVARVLETREAAGPESVRDDGHGGGMRERLAITHVIGTPEEFQGALLVARDLTYASQVDRMVRYSRKLASLGRILAGVAHEVKNPLNAMTIHLELLKQKLRGQFAWAPPAAEGVERSLASPAAAGPGGPRAGALKHVEVIDQEIRRLDQVMQDFLKFVRPGDLKLQPLRLDALLEEIAPILEPEVDRTGVRLQMTSAPSLPLISGDAGMLKQALLNLALNACQAMPDGGTLRIACQAAAADRVRIDVEDTGTGIAPENLQRIFDLYFTTKDKGSGIGLSLVYRIVQLHDGDIEVQSIVGRGTTFRILLPRAEPPERTEVRTADAGVAVT